MKKSKSKLMIGIIGIGMVGGPLKDWFLSRGWKRGQDLFCFDTDIKKSYNDDVHSRADIVFVCVPTPSFHDGSCNISIVESVVGEMVERKGKNRSGRCIVIKSTVLPGTVRYLNLKYKSKGCFIFNPEFLTEAQANEDFLRPDRQIVASADTDAEKWQSVILNLLPMGSFQTPGVGGTYEYFSINSTEAELSKYGGNIFGAMKVSYANVLNIFCEALDIRFESVRRVIAHDRRINDSFMDVNHGKFRGFGGYCFPKDLKALILFGQSKIDAMKNPADRRKKKLLKVAVGFLKSIRELNLALLEEQELTEEGVSVHDVLLEDALKKPRKGER